MTEVMTAKENWRSVTKAHVGILQQALFLVGVSVACQWCQGNSTHRWKTHLLAQIRFVFNGMWDRMKFENPTPKSYDIPFLWGPMAILNPVFNMEHCKKMLRKARTRQASNEPNAETPIRVEMGYVHIYIYDISICNNVEFIKKSVLPAFQHPKTSKPFSLVSDVQHFEWADPANGLKADPQNWLKAHPKGTTL